MWLSLGKNAQGFLTLSSILQMYLTDHSAEEEGLAAEQETALYFKSLEINFLFFSVKFSSQAKLKNLRLASHTFKTS